MTRATGRAIRGGPGQNISDESKHAKFDQYGHRIGRYTTTPTNQKRKK
jgi:hypothetical protein